MESRPSAPSRRMLDTVAGHEAPPHSLDVEVEEFPGGARIEVRTRSAGWRLLAFLAAVVGLSAVAIAILQFTSRLAGDRACGFVVLLGALCLALAVGAIRRTSGHVLVLEITPGHLRIDQADGPRTWLRSEIASLRIEPWARGLLNDRPRGMLRHVDGSEEVLFDAFYERELRWLMGLISHLLRSEQRPA